MRQESEGGQDELARPIVSEGGRTAGSMGREMRQQQLQEGQLAPMIAQPTEDWSESVLLHKEDGTDGRSIEL